MDPDSNSIPINEARVQIFEGMFLAGMNLRYHQALSTWITRIEHAFKIITAVAASGAFAASPAWNTRVGEKVWLVVGLIAAVAGVCSAILPFRKMLKYQSEMESQWLELRDHWEKLYRAVNAKRKLRDATEFPNQSIEELFDVQSSVEGREKGAPVGLLLDRAYLAECAYRNVQPKEKPKLRGKKTPAAAKSI